MLSRNGLGDRLAEIVRQQLICRIASQVDEPVVVDEMELTVAEAWELLDKLEYSPTEDEEDWLGEGV